MSRSSLTEPPCGEDNDLPEGWVAEGIRDLLELRYGKALKAENRKAGGVTVFGSNGIVGTHNVPLGKGPVVLVGRKGSVGAVHFHAGPFWAIDTTYFIDDFRGLDPTYLAFALRSADLSKLESSSAIPGLSREAIYDELLAVPPFAEQRRIVSRVEELLARVNAASNRLVRVPATLKRFRRAVLSAACDGRLTEEWRVSNGDKPADPSIRAEEGLPVSWSWGSGATLFRWGSGKFLPKNQQREGPFPIYGGNGIAGYHAESLTQRPTLVIGRVGALCGNIHLTPGPAWVTDNAIYASEVAPDVNLRYASWVFSRADLNANAGGSGQPFVSQQTLNDVRVPLPPKEEQREIVHRVEALFKRADAIEARVATATARAEKLTQAILAKAFRGELVPTEADLARREGREYESAEDLLRRFRVHGGTTGARAPRKGARRKAG